MDKNCKSALIVIDIQPCFITEEHLSSDPQWFIDLFSKIKIEIKNTLDSGGHVFIVECIGHGNTFYNIFDDNMHHENLHFVSKEGSDGAVEIESRFQEFDIEPEEIKIAGINRSACVGDTAASLSTSYEDSQIIMLEDIIDDLWGFYGWGYLDLKNINAEAYGNVFFSKEGRTEELPSFRWHDTCAQ